MIKEPRRGYQQGNVASRYSPLVDDGTHGTHIFVSRYKALGASAIDETGARDHAEFLNIAQDDALSYPIPARRTYPGPVNARMESTIVPFIRKSAEINLTLLGVLNDRLGLPEGTLGNKHLIDRPSGSEARCIKSPPTQEILSEKASIGAHTDFGSLVSSLFVMLPCGANSFKHRIGISVLPAQQARRVTSTTTRNKYLEIREGESCGHGFLHKVRLIPLLVAHPWSCNL